MILASNITSLNLGVLPALILLGAACLIPCIITHMSGGSAFEIARMKERERLLRDN